METLKPITTHPRVMRMCEDCGADTFDRLCHRCAMAAYGEEEPHSRYEGDPDRQRADDAGVKQWGEL